MKTKIIYTIVFLMIAKLAYSQEEQYSADKFVAKCPNEIIHRSNIGSQQHQSRHI